MTKVKKSKRFNYNLASVLKVRKIKEILQKEEVSKAIQKVKEEKEKQQKIEDDQNAEHQKIIDIYESGEAIDLDEIFLRRHHLENLKVQYDKQLIETEKAEQKKIEEDKKLLQALKDKKILEKDKDKKRGQWKKIMEKENVKFLDDISVSRFFRNRNKEDE